MRHSRYITLFCEDCLCYYRKSSGPCHGPYNWHQHITGPGHQAAMKAHAKKHAKCEAIRKEFPPTIHTENLVAPVSTKRGKAEEKTDLPALKQLLAKVNKVERKASALERSI